MTTSQDYLVFVNSTDTFEDCWTPFFSLLQAYWPGFAARLVLNTDTKAFSHPGLEIDCTRTAAGFARRLTWSESLASALSGIESEWILYMQDDYFLNGPVRSDVVDEMLTSAKRLGADSLRLMEFPGSGPWSASAIPGVWQVDRSSRYRIALQAGLWRVRALRSLLRAHESPWELEVLGSRRRRAKEMGVYCVDRDAYMAPGSEVVPYTPTGIVKGRWNRSAVEALFGDHGICVDFSVRGFVEDAPSSGPDYLGLPARLLRRVRSIG